jgi:hypothetical protein
LSEKVYNPSELAKVPKKINASSDNNPVLFCNAVQSLEASRLRAPFTHATASTTKKGKEELQRENQHSIQAQDAAETTTVLSAPYLY